VDYILIIYDAFRTNLDTITQYAGSIHHSLQFNPTLESYDQINFLDLSIIRKPPKLETDIFCKPTTTDITIHYLSNHPTEHKLAAYRYYIERMFNIPLNDDQQHSEWQTILHIAKKQQIPNNPPSQIKTPNTTQNNVRHTPTSTENSPQWATFTFTSPHICRITNLFKHTNVRIAFRSLNTLMLESPSDTTTPQHNSQNHLMTTRSHPITNGDLQTNMQFL